MTLITPSILWEATDGELKQLMAEVQRELILRNTHRTITEPWLTNLIDTPLAEEVYGG